MFEWALIFYQFEPKDHGWIGQCLYTMKKHVALLKIMMEWSRTWKETICKI